MDLQKTEKAILAGGCFWCVEAIYLNLKGVISVKSGYTDGKTKNPSYEAVCTGFTGHAEAIEIIFNPDIVTYQTILEVFFATHDPTTLNRQGNDIGTQYRSSIFYLTETQKNIAQQEIEKLEKEKIFINPIVTTIIKASIFYDAESYHQNYYNNNKQQGYCNAVITPKLEKFKSKFKSKIK